MQNESPKTFVFISEPQPILLRNATSNGGDASRVGKICSYYLAEFVYLSSLCLTQDASPPLEVASCGSILWGRLTLEQALE